MWWVERGWVSKNEKRATTGSRSQDQSGSRSARLRVRHRHDRLVAREHVEDADVEPVEPRRDLDDEVAEVEAAFLREVDPAEAVGDDLAGELAQDLALERLLEVGERVALEAAGALVLVQVLRLRRAEQPRVVEVGAAEG